jgi:hypothetical protein
MALLAVVVEEADHAARHVGGGAVQQRQPAVVDGAGEALRERHLQGGVRLNADHVEALGQIERRVVALAHPDVDDEVAVDGHGAVQVR